MAADAEAILLPLLNDLGVTPPDGWRNWVQTFYDDLVDANRSTNLTRITLYRDFLTKHIADSWLVLKAAPDLRAQPCTVADVGCGAGFPGLPLALIWPQARLMEIEANQKKNDYVAGVIVRLGLAERVSAVRGRARELGRQPEHHGRYQVVLARAVADTATLIKECRQLLAPTGLLIACKTPDAVEEERALASREAAKAGLLLSESAVFTLPENAGERQFFLLQAADG